ncbi:TonB-dependent siderophore receptor [Erythrobacter sp. YT30]|uniref:TonB-dependent receptor plug domain-containing protein n=1 Tax=Erythrobacter sp. YT30 TaxID=1735012 RepID=UPI00076BE9B3|nr:TonB-dependent receptor [Erythrobacter sp. YT30]KWV90629.1 TonB-dependent receptor [Erythrobacter sp. YT30]
MRFTKLLCGAAVCALGWSAPLAAQDDTIEDSASSDSGAVSLQALISPNLILVSADRAKNGVRTSTFTGSATIVTPQQIQQRQIRNIEDVLRDVPGVAVASTPGQTQIRLRGTEANHVLVLVDGIEVSDPGSGEFDIGTLQAEIGSRLEVLRGPQSALYGNDAIGGVVAYQSASGRDLEGLSAFLEAGTNATFNVGARAGFLGDGWDAALSGVVVSTDGEPNARGGNRDIGRESATLSGKGSVELTDGVTIRAVARYTSTEGRFNEQDFTFGSPTFGLVIDSPGTRFENESFSALVGARFEALNGSWTHDLSAQITDANRDTVQPAGFPSGTESDRFKASYVSAYNFGGSDHSITFAADYEEEGFNNVLTFNDRNEVENVGLVGEYRYAGDEFDFSAAIRHDINDRFQDATTFRVGAGYSLTNTTRVRAAAGSGVKNPTLNELFGFFDGMFLGNPDLQPEKSISWEIGVDQSFADGNATISVTYFNAELDNEIFTTFPPPTFIATPGNRDTESKQQGVEVAVTADLGAGFSFNGAYTYLDAEEDGTEEVRRPDHIASAVLNWTEPKERFSANLAVRYNGDARDLDFSTGAFPAPQTTLDDYTLVNFNARVEIANGISAFGRVENLLDEQYEQVFSFVSPGRTALIGIQAGF